MLNISVKNKKNFILKISSFFIVIIVLIIYFLHFKDKITYIKSDIDNKYYIVRNLNDKKKAANLIASIRGRIFELVNYMYKNKSTKYLEYEYYIDLVYNRIQNTIMKESSPYSRYTSYSVNKGDEIVFCLRSKKEKNKLHDINLLMYVTIHELAHIGCPEVGHTQLFKKIFAFFLQVAIDIKIYNYLDYSKDSKEYCGLNINNSII